MDPEVLIPDLTCSPSLSSYDAFTGSQALGISGCAHLSVTGNLVVQGSRAVSLGPKKGSRQRAVEAEGRGTLGTQVSRPDLWQPPPPLLLYSSHPSESSLHR